MSTERGRMRAGGPMLSRMIDIRTERLLPVARVPEYLASRGLGHRVHAGAVYRWILVGVAGVRLEAVRIRGRTVTSVEAIQRWVEARSAACSPTARGQESAAQPIAPTVPRSLARIPRLASAEVEQGEALTKLLMENRVVPTPLDHVIELFNFPTSARKYVASALFRAGLRTDGDVRGWTREQLLAVAGIGPTHRPVVAALKEAVDRGTAEAASAAGSTAARR